MSYHHEISKLGIDFDYKNNGIARVTQGRNAISGKAAILPCRPFAYFPAGRDGFVSTWDGWKIYACNESDAKKIVEKEIVKSWNDAYAAKYCEIHGVSI